MGCCQSKVTTNRPAIDPADLHEEGTSKQDGGDGIFDTVEAVVREPLSALPFEHSQSWPSSNHHGSVERCSARFRKGALDGETIDVEKTVSTCWKEIEEQCRTCQREQGKGPSPVQGGWQVVRVFVSSTFADFHSEREALVKKVFPELHEWCKGRQLHLVECDLRWGVPKDSTSQTTISICLEELDRCLKETDGQPFFLAMLGERYGWIPSLQDVSSEIRERFSWVDHLSITHMEIVRGAVRFNNSNAAFFLRDPGFLKDVPQDQLRNFVDTAELNTQQQKELKSYLRTKFPNQVHSYKCKIDSVTEAEVQLSGLGKFCKQAVKFLKTVIDRRYPESRGNLSIRNQAALPHTTFMEEKGRFLTGRDAEIQRVVKFALSHWTSEPYKEVCKVNDLPDVSSDIPGAEEPPVWFGVSLEPEPASRDRTLMVVLGESGTGKSLFMARCAMEIRKKTKNFLYHFVGCCPESLDVNNILLRLRGHMEIDQCDIAGEFGDVKRVTLKRKPSNYLNKCPLNENRLVILIDAINQISDSKTPAHLEWLPPALPSNVRCIISTSMDPATLRKLRERQPPPCEMKLLDLDQQARRNIATAYFKEYNKILDDEQLDLLTSSAGAGNPVWLAMACEELRVFGDFSRLTEKIKCLPASMEGLMHICITRVVKEDDTGCVEKMLCLIECSQLGLQEPELQVLLGDPETATPLPALTWGQVLRSLRRFLRNTAGYQNLPVLGFFHHSVSKVVQNSLIRTPAVRQSYHNVLAAYYQGQCAVQQLVARKLPYQLQKTGMSGKLVEFLQKDPRSLYMTATDRQKYMNGVRCSNKIPSEELDLRTAIVLCKMCATRNKVFIPSKELNKDVCVICGLKTTTKALNQQVYFCALHDPPGTEGKDWCISCQTSGKKAVTSSRAHLCVQCSSDSLENTCARLMV
ncbi:TEP1 [Branchiostoma lanceolatum]|uniref:TEP1 protein n=1 Tax=Branchiostoma lanceolatum TaxID=7740 RepID=A0A8J9Z3E5_BRALA|nr:TEP1 [Branchiostoma lanceolatum]